MARSGWIDMEALIGPNDFDVLLEAINEADIWFIDVVGTTPAPLACCSSEADRVLFLLALDRADVAFTGSRGASYIAVLEDTADLTTARMELARVTCGRGEMLSGQRVYLHVANAGYGRALRTAMHIRASRFSGFFALL